MTRVRTYQAGDKEKCLAIFKSNCPKFFDESEYDLFEKWLNHQGNNNSDYSSPTYTNTLKDEYYVVENNEQGIIACAGFYVCKDVKEARLAWGMVHADFHNKGIGKLLYQHRKQEINKNWPDHKITLGTSQHTYPFYEKMGMKVVNIIKSGYGKDLDRVDMTL